MNAIEHLLSNLSELRCKSSTNHKSVKVKEKVVAILVHNVGVVTVIAHISDPSFFEK